MSDFYDVVLWMENCDPGRLTANRTMLITRTAFIQDKGRDFFPEEYLAIIRASGSAGIMKP